LSQPSPLLRPPPTAARPSRHFPTPVIGGTSLPVPRRHGAETALPSSEINLATVPIPLRRRVHRHPLQDQRCRPWPSPCLEKLGSPLSPQSPRRRTCRRCRIHLMLRTGHSPPLPNERLDTPLRRTGSLPTAGGLATRDPGISPDRTSTGWLTSASRSGTTYRITSLPQSKRPSSWAHVTKYPNVCLC